MLAGVDPALDAAIVAALQALAVQAGDGLRQAGRGRHVRRSRPGSSSATERMRRALALSSLCALAVCARAPGAARAAGRRPDRVTKPPKLVKFVEAVYPKDKHDAGITASVLLSIEIGDDGKVGEVEVVKSARRPTSTPPRSRRPSSSSSSRPRSTTSRRR